MTDGEIEEILAHVDDLVKWATEIKDYATKVAVESHKSWAGFKLVEGRSIRQFTNEEAVIQAAEAEGFTDLYKQSLVSLTELEKRMGKKEFNRVLGHLVHKPQGKLTLVPESDKRKEYIPAAAEFGGN